MKEYDIPVTTTVRTQRVFRVRARSGQEAAMILGRDHATLTPISEEVVDSDERAGRPSPVKTDDQPQLPEHDSDGDIEAAGDVGEAEQRDRPAPSGNHPIPGRPMRPRP